MSRVFNGSLTGANETYVHTSTSAAINTLQAVTLAAWIYNTDNGVNGVVAWKDGFNANGPLLLNLSGSPFAQVLGTVSGSAAIGASTLSLNAWSHIALTFDFSGDKKARVYLNGVLDGTGPAIVGSVVNDSADGFWFGNDNRDEGFTGNIAEVVEYNVALTAPQVAALAASTTGATAVLPANIVGYWHLLGTTSPEPDSSGNGNSGVLSASSPIQGPNSPGYSPVFSNGSNVLGAFGGSSLATAFYNPNKFDLIQVVNEGGSVVWNLSSTGIATFNPTNPTMQSLLGKFEGQTFAQAFPNPGKQDIIQIVSLGGTIVFSVDYTGTSS